MKIYLKAPTGQQQKFIDCGEREQLYGGAKRGGKTVAGAMKSVLLSIMFPGNRGLIGRKDMTDLKDTALTTFFDICPPELILDHHKGDRKIVIRTNDKPSEILYRGLGDQADVEKSKGIDLGWAWIDEPSEIEEDTYKMLRSQLNWVLPDGNRPPYMMLLTSNPEPGARMGEAAVHRYDGRRGRGSSPHSLGTTRTCPQVGRTNSAPAMTPIGSRSTSTAPGTCRKVLSSRNSMRPFMPSRASTSGT
jgi:Phage terminase large subunit